MCYHLKSLVHSRVLFELEPPKYRTESRSMRCLPALISVKLFGTSLDSSTEKREIDGGFGKRLQNPGTWVAICPRVGKPALVAGLER